MDKFDRYKIQASQTLKDAVTVIHKNFSRCVVVLNKRGKVIGVFSEGDVLRAILQDIDLHTPLRKIVKPSFIYLNKREMREAYRLIKKHGITLLPVLDDNFYLTDIITIFDVMEHLVLSLPENN